LQADISPVLSDSHRSKLVIGQYGIANYVAMKKQMKNRASGIDCIGPVPWGTHICHFYQSKSDLIEILVPYFQTGLENNEYCVWANSDPLSAKESLAELGKALPNLELYLNRQQIMVTDFTFRAGQSKFDAENALQALVETVEFALNHGFDGLRVCSNTSWLTKEEWAPFTHFELSADLVLRRLKAIALCSYPLDHCTPGDIVEVVSGHRFVLIRATDGWRLIRNNGNERLASLRNKGLTYREIGQILGVSKQRIADVLSPNRNTDALSAKNRQLAGSDGLLSATDAARILGVHPNTIRRWSDDGLIHAYRVGKRSDRRFSRADLENFLKSHK
jgi:excisionase family DNA binding protein